MSDPAVERLRALGAQLRRIRMAENPEADGAKQVWHTAGQGIDLVTHVDAEGRAERQELAFHKVAVVWKKGGLVRTASQFGKASGNVRNSSEILSYHDTPDEDVLRRASTLLGAAPPGDRYLDHFGLVVSHALEEAAAQPRDTVTNHQKVKIGAPVTAPPPQPEPVKPPPSGVFARLLQRLGLRAGN